MIILHGVICIWFALCSGLALFNGFYLLSGGEYYGSRTIESFFIGGTIYAGIAYIFYLGRKRYIKIKKEGNMAKEELTLSDALGIDTEQYQRMAKAHEQLLKKANKALQHYIHNNKIRFSIALGALRSEVRIIGLFDSIRYILGQEKGIIDVCILAMVDVYGEEKTTVAFESILKESEKSEEDTELAKRLGIM